MEGRHRRDGDHPAVAWRLGQAGPRGDRRARGRRRDAGARKRHQRHRREVRQDQCRLAHALPNNSAPYTSTIVFLVRKGNPKGINDWGDLIKDGVAVITPNPKTSGGARWNYLAAWAWANEQVRRRRSQDQGIRRQPLQPCAGARHRRARLDRDLRPARASATCCWPGRTRPIWRSTNSAPTSSTSSIPPTSILAEPPVAVVDANVDAKGTRKVAEAYLEYLYSAEGQTHRRQEPLPSVQARAGAGRAISPSCPRSSSSPSTIRSSAAGRRRSPPFRRRRHLRPDLQAGPVSRRRSAMTTAHAAAARGGGSGSRASFRVSD